MENRSASPLATRHSPLFIGIDFGTSGCRACAIDAQRVPHAEVQYDLPAPVRDGNRCEQDPEVWWQALCELLDALLQRVPVGAVRALAVDGTSSTLLLTDADGVPLGPALLYNDARATAQATCIAAIAPPECGAHGASASLAKLLYLAERAPAGRVRHALHQADWLAGRLTGHYGVSDENNALKLGYDARERDWPEWLGRLSFDTNLLPRVVPPGTSLGPIDTGIAQRFGFNTRMQVVAGTTDSTAAFIATGATATGAAVTSLGSTLVLKVLAERPVFAPEYGVYSHRLGECWLVGGASNSGGAVLRQFFTQAQLDVMTPQLRPDEPTGLDYYPLPGPGERFPSNDPTRAPRITPRPDDDVRFFQGLLEGIAHIEQRGYRLLEQLGAPYPVSVRSVGGGAANAAWTRIRGRLLGVPMLAPEHTQAAYGAAFLAMRGSCIL